jgi:hypothetical protein
MLPMPIQSGVCDRPLKIVMAVWRTFFEFEFELAGSGVQPAADYHSCLVRFKF